MYGGVLPGPARAILDNIAGALIIITAILGFYNAPPIWIVIMTVPLMLIYYIIRATTFLSALQQGIFRFIWAIVLMFALLCIPAAAAFYVGVGISKLF